MLWRVMMGAALVAVGYYLGREMGRAEAGGMAHAGAMDEAAAADEGEVAATPADAEAGGDTAREGPGAAPPTP